MPNRIKYDGKKLTAALIHYIERTECPTVAGFAFEQRIHRPRLYQVAERHEPLSDALKLCITKKEDVLEQGMLCGRYPPSAAIFSLKQLGWRDTQALEHSGPGGVPLTIKTIVEFVESPRAAD